MLAGAGTVAIALPWGCGDDAPPPARGRFLDEHGWATIDLATDLVIPPTGGGPGARDAHVVAYIDGLCAAFDVSPPAIFAGGPFSGRTAFPDGEVPADDFAHFLPLSRVRTIAWRTRVDGWRELYAGGIVALDDAAAQIQRGARFVDLSSATDRALALSDADGAVPGFADTFTAHVIEGMFAAPEYGGNAGLAGWRLARWDGDSAPLGHAIFDEARGAYVDRADQPTSTASPGDVAEDFSDDVIQLLTIAALGSGGMRFY